MAKSIILGENETLQSFEGLMRTNLRPSLRRSEVLFDLRGLRSIGLFPATLLFCWVAELRRGSRVDVRFELPPRGVLADSDARLLLDSEVLRQISGLGVELDYDSPSVTAGVPMEMLLTPPSESLLQRVADQFRAGSSEVGEDMIRDLSHGVLFDLLENAVIHGGAQSAYFIARNVAARAKQDAFFTAFAPAESYFELAVGDVGPGIREVLAAHIPADYKLSFATQTMPSDDERLIFYAFEYASTSSMPARRERLRTHLQNLDIDPNRVATGLSCVLNIVRDRHGQLVIRTSGAIISLDFWRGSAPLVRMTRAITRGPLAALRGTQYFLRLPARRLGLKTAYSKGIPESTLLDRIDVVRPFDIVEPHSSDEADRVSAAIDYMSLHFRERIDTLGLTIVRPSRNPLTSRACALFGAALTMQNRGSRHLLCLERYSGESAYASSTYVPPPSHDVGVILEGDIFRNAFRNVERAGTEVPSYLAESKDDVFRLNNVIVAKVRDVLRRSIRSELQAILKAPSVRLTEGPFLIEGQYYTNAFYTVADAAIDDPYNSELLAQWAASVIPDDCDTLIAVTKPVIPIIARIAALVYDLRQIQLRIVTNANELASSRPAGEEWTCVALTDVVCRGEVLNAALAAVQPSTLTAVLTFVDSRPAAPHGDSLEYTAGGTTRNVRLWSIVRDPLRTFSTFREAVEGRNANRPQGGKTEQYSISFAPSGRIIDPVVHRPAVYVRDQEIAGDFNQLLEAAQKADGLLYRHALYHGRHYTIFLHFPRLFLALRASIERWLDLETRKLPRTDARHCIVADTDGSLLWLRAQLADSYPTMTIETVSWDDIRAPRPPGKQTSGSEHCLVIIPGSASGDLARRALEFASRRGPSAVTILIVIARMEPSHLSFLLGISQYRGIPVHFACFAQFPVRAYPDELSCPVCGARRAIDRLRESLMQPLLREVLDRKSAFMAPLDVDRPDDELTFVVSSDELRRTRLRALYEAAEYDLKARYDLTTTLQRGSTDIDDFLEVISREYRSEHFAVEILKRRLLSAFDRVLTRVSDLLLNAAPPVSLASKLPALAHLSEELFVIAIPRLLRAYSESSEEMEELCIALALLRVLPVVALASDGPSPEAGDPQALLLDTVDFLRTPSHLDEAAAFVEQIETLWARLVRSSLVTERIPKFKAIVARKNSSTTRVEEVAQHVYDGWTAELAELLARMLRNHHWPEFAKRHTRLADSVLSFAQLMNRIRQVATNETARATDDLKALAAAVDEARKELAGHIRGLFISPLYCAAARFPSGLKTESGAEIHLSKDIDYEVPLVFADLETLNDVCEEVRTNWQKHSLGFSPHVRVNIRRDGQFVVVALSDDIPGDLRRLSVGGLRVLREFCEAYGGTFEYSDARDADGMKTVSLFLRTQSIEA